MKYAYLCIKNAHLFVLIVITCAAATPAQALHDNYIFVPNAIGLGLSLAQLSLACLYPKRNLHSQHHGGMMQQSKQGA